MVNKTLKFTFVDFLLDSMCKFPGCKKPRFKESARKVHDYCGKTHSEAHSQLLQPSTGKLVLL